MIKDYEFKVHKTILIARSPVFSNMLESNMKVQMKKKIISDIELHIFQFVLLYMYTDIFFKEKYAIDLLKVTNKIKKI